MYKVLKAFKDLQDAEYIYSAGDTYPREGYTPAPERIAELSGSDNRIGVPLIREPKKRKGKSKRHDD